MCVCVCVCVCVSFGTENKTKKKREFVKKNYKDLKTKNPSFPFLVRECEGAEAKVWARYDKGVEKNVSVEGLTAKSVEEQLQTLVTQKA